MKEILSIHLGQCGVQLGNAMWELISYEHGLDTEGRLLPQYQAATVAEMSGEALNSFFYEISGKFVPRAILLDLEPTVIGESFFPAINPLLTARENAVSA